MGLFDKQREMFAAARQHVAGLCPPDDPLVGAFVGAHAKTFSNRLYTVGATRNFLVLQAINKKFLPDGNPIWLRPSAGLVAPVREQPRGLEGAQAEGGHVGTGPVELRDVIAALLESTEGPAPPGPAGAPPAGQDQ